MRPIRVVQVLEATAGGTRRHLAESCDALYGDGELASEFELEIVCAAAQEPAFRVDLERYRERGHRVTELRMGRRPNPLRDWGVVRDLRRILRRSEPDVVHLHSAVAVWVGRLAARGLGCRVLYSPHAFPFLRDVAAPLRRVYEGAERVAARWTDLLVAVSQAEARLAVELGLLPEERVSVLENAVDLPALESEVGPMPPIRSPEGQRVFGLVGALRAQKAPLLLLDAARRARAGGVRARYVLPSTGPDLARVKRAVREYGLHGIVDFAPAENGLAELYRRIDVGVLPSLWEGLPYTLLETTGLGRPLIASDLPVFQDFLRPLDARLLFQRGDAEALARCIALWAGLPSEVLEDVGRRGRSQVARDHALPEWANALQALYRPGDRP